MDHDMYDQNEHDSNEYITNLVAKKNPVEEVKFGETDVCCCFVNERMYFVLHCGLVQVIQVGNGLLDEVTSFRGRPVELANVN